MKLKFYRQRSLLSNVALAFVTIHPVQFMGIDHRVCYVEEGAYVCHCLSPTQAEPFRAYARAQVSSFAPTTLTSMSLVRMGFALNLGI